MKSITKKIITVSACLMAAGAVLAGIGYLFGGRAGVSITRNGIGSNNIKSEAVTLEKTKLNTFTEAEITMDAYADIHVLPSDDDNYYVEYLLDKAFGDPQYKVTNGKFTLYQPDSNHGVFLAFSTVSDSLNTYVNLYVPKDKTLDTLKIYDDSGDVSITGTKAANMDITVDYGDLTLKEISSTSLKITLDSGDLDLKDTETGTFTLYSEYGDSTLKNFKCDTAKANLDSGSLYMDAAKIKSLNCTSEYGDVNLYLPEKLETYTFDVTAEYGQIYLPDKAPKGHYTDRDDDQEYYQTDGTSQNLIKIYADSGDIEIRER